MIPMFNNIFAVKEELVGCSVAITLKGNPFPFEEKWQYLTILDISWLLLTRKSRLAHGFRSQK